jgi:hypothetical protein
MELFPQLPENISDLSVEELQALLDARLEVVAQIESGEIEATDDVVADLTEGVAQIRALRDELGQREQAEQARSDEVARLAAEARGEDLAADEPEEEDPKQPPTPDEPDEEPVEEPAPDQPAEPEPDAAPAAEPEAVVASTRPRPLAPPRARNRAIQNTPTPLDSPGTRAVLLASGEEIRGGDRIEIAKALIEARRRFGNTPDGYTEDVPIVRFQSSYPDERQLTASASEWENAEKIENVTSLVAAGGLCAPVTPYYDLEMLSVADRPVRDSLPGFNADRGGIRFATPPKLTGVTTGIGRVTAAQDLAGGSTGTKNCQVIPCPAFSEVDIDAVYHCIRAGNFGTRAFPEQLAQFQDLVMAAHARLAETGLLDGISSASTAATDPQVTGAVGDLFHAVLSAADAMRSRHRMAPTTRLRAVFPFWVADVLVADLVRSQFTRFEYNRAGVEALLQELCNINVTWTLDGPTGGAQVFGTQTSGQPLLPFPTSLIWFLFPEGSFLYLDGGELDFGLVRDSTLNSTNDFQIFAEIFEQIAFVGVESLKITTTFCPTGGTGAAASITCGS